MASTTLEERPAKRVQRSEPSHQRITVKNPEWGYAHLQMIFDPPHESTSPSFPPDILTWHTALTSAITQFLGVMGAAIHIDILHLQHDKVWLRLPRADLTRFGAAVSGYVGNSDGRTFGFKTVAMGEYLVGVVGRSTEAEVWAE